MFLSVAGADITINRTDYIDKLRGYWLGVSIANWTGLPTENRRTYAPFFTDSDWGSATDYVLNQDPWAADDDSNIEYIYQHAMETYTYKLTGAQIAREWVDHVGLPKVWVANLAALCQMQNGVVPPETSLPENNPMWEMIDAQLTTEIFGALAPARPDVALDIAHLPIRTTAYLHSEWASEFYVIMYSLASCVDTNLPPDEQVIWMGEQARKRIPDWSYIADMYDFVKQEFDNNPDKDDWESTRDLVFQRYQQNITAGYHYQYPWDAGINFAASIVSLLYGGGDFKKTIRVACMCGWDSDNPPATWGGMLGLMYGHSGLEEHFNKYDFSDGYNLYGARFSLPIMNDNFTSMAQRAITLIDSIVVNEMGGTVDGDNWIMPDAGTGITKAAVPETEIPWKIIEDYDDRWRFNGFTVQQRDWNASGATISNGYSGCEADITFTGTAVQYYAYRDPGSGSVTVSLDGVEQGTYSLHCNSSISPHSGNAQYYYKVFEVFDLPLTEHTLRIVGNSDNTRKTVDMLQIIDKESGGISLSLIPQSPENGDAVTVAAIVSGDRTISSAVIKWGTVSGSLTNEVSMTADGNTYTGVIPGQNSGTVIYYRVEAEDNEGNTIISSEASYLTATYSAQWHSYNIALSEGAPQGTVGEGDGSGTAADIEFYESTDNDGVSKGTLFSSYHNTHADVFNNLGAYWSSSGDYPYAGKSSVGRGNDTGEDKAPDPAGVMDLQMHPPDNDHLTVCAFIVPEDGFYAVADLGIRRVAGDGGLSSVRAFDGSGNELGSLNAGNRTWNVSSDVLAAGNMTQGDRIYFAVDNVDGYGYDATEISWTVKKVDGTQASSLGMLPGTKQVSVLYCQSTERFIFENSEQIDKVALISLAGKTIIKERRLRSGFLDAGDLLSGVYCLRITDKGGRIWNHKIVAHD